MSSIQLVAFSAEAPARLLVNELGSRQVSAHYQQGSGEFAHCVFVDNPQQLDLAQTIAREFISNPQDKRYQKNAWQNAEAVQLTGGQPILGRFNLPSFAAAPITWLVSGVCVFFYLGIMLGMLPGVMQLLHIQPLSVLVENGQWWRLIGPVFVHFSAIHIVFNVLWWSSLGAEIEKKLGHVTLLLLFLASALVSNLGQLWVSGPNFGGLSGVVYAVVGFVWWLGWLRPGWGLSLSKPVVGFLLVWLVLGYMDVLWVNMANTAHTLGLLCGCLGAWLTVRLTKSR